MRAGTEKEILLLDSTLGLGGKLIDWNYGETVIPSLRRLSVKSGLDIVEYGLLRSYPLGPTCAVYQSTILPPGFEKEQGQRYVMFLAQDYWPEISGIPEQNDRTADMIRVCITPERQDEEFAYCTALVQKGYQVITLLDEIGQYTEEELSALLRGVDTVRPWACCLFDTSGVLDEEHLNIIFSLCDKILGLDIRIGFHGCDNLQCLFELAKAFCKLETERSLCVDVSAGGIGAGALHLSTRVFAEWMNDTFGRSYDLPVLAFQETYTKQYLEPKLDPGVQFLYHVAAKQKCSYRYTEYYYELFIEPSDQIGIYPEIERKFAFRFDKSAANRALLHYRKKRLNLVIIIPTANRWRTVDSLLFVAARELLRYGADVVIYDSSDDNRTQAVTMNFQTDGYDNIYYKRYTGEFDGLSIDKKVISAFQEHLTYDYIWLCRDGLIPTISQFYYDLISLTEQEIEFIAVDWSCRNYNRHSVKTYDNCVDFFRENVERMNTLGCTIFKSSFVEKLLRDQPLNESNYGFWIPIAGLHQMAKENVLSGQIISNVFQYNPGAPSSSYWVKSLLRTWGENWYRTISSLPEIYDSAKAKAMKVRTIDFCPFNLKSMLMLRSLNGFNISVYRQYRYILSQISENPPWKFYIAALIPKPLARFILRFNRFVAAHPDYWISRVFGKLFDFYVRLGR